MIKAVHRHGTGLERIELERLRSRVGQLFAALQDAAEMVAPHAPGAWLPPVDLCESNDAVAVYVELPGVRAEHIEVALTSAQLRISGRKKKSAPRGVISHLCSERGYGQFMRVVPLYWPIRTSGARAELKDGVLTVYLPKLKERRGGEFKITIKESDE
jgi:HSP20 family protein